MILTGLISIKVLGLLRTYIKEAFYKKKRKKKGTDLMMIHEGLERGMWQCVRERNICLSRHASCIGVRTVFMER